MDGVGVQLVKYSDWSKITYMFMHFRLSSTLEYPKTQMEVTVCNAFFVIVSKSVRFHFPTQETERFKSDAFSKHSSLEIFFYWKNSFFINGCKRLTINYRQKMQNK